MYLRVEILVILYQSTDGIQTIELFAPVIIFGNVSCKLFEKLFGISNWSQFLFGNILRGLVVNLMLFFLSKDTVTDPAFFI